MTTNLYLADSIVKLEEMRDETFDLIVFDPDHAMQDKDKCLYNCWRNAGKYPTLLFYGKNHQTIIELIGNSPWKARQLINLFLDGEQIGVVIVATTGHYTTLDFPDLQNHHVDTKGADGHPTSKDASWLDMFLDTGRYKNVLDPFMGSAQWGIACKQRNIDYTGIEIDPEYFAMAEKNLGYN